MTKVMDIALNNWGVTVAEPRVANLEPTYAEERVRGARTMNPRVPIIDAMGRLISPPFHRSVVMAGTPTEI